jgi:hypothetical protein
MKRQLLTRFMCFATCALDSISTVVAASVLVLINAAAQLNASIQRTASDVLTGPARAG